MIIRKSAGGFIYFSSSPVRLLLEVAALSIKYSKTLNFRKSAAAPLAFRINSGGAVLIKCVFSSCIVPESVGFVSWSVCACVILGAGSRGRGLWGYIKGLLIKNSRTGPWRETHLGKNINE